MREIYARRSAKKSKNMEKDKDKRKGTVEAQRSRPEST